MKLFYAPASPYARTIRVALIERGLTDQVEMQEVTLRDPASALLPYNPVGRVPTLQLDNGVVLSETLLILGHVDTLHGGRPLLPRDGSDGWATTGRLGRAIGMLDSVVTWNRELRRPENEQSTAIIALETTRASRTMDTLDTAVTEDGWNGPIDASHIGLGAALGFCERRHRSWPWRRGRPALSAWYDRIAATPSFQATIPPII